MQKYTLSERDIIELIGAAGNAVCEDRIFPQGCDLLIMEISAEILKRLIGHLSGSNPFPEDVLKMITVLLKNEEANRMPEYDFVDLYDQMRDAISAYKDPGERIAYIAGYFKGMNPDTALTAGQVSQILALRYPEEEKNTCIGWGATGA